MGAKSTKLMTREQVLSEIYQKVARSSDRELEDILEILVGNEQLHNYSIVSEEELIRENKRWEEAFRLIRNEPDVD